MGDAKFNEMLGKIMSGLKELTDRNEQFLPEVKAAEDELRLRMAEVRKTAFPRHVEACGTGPDVADVFRSGVQSRPTLDAVRQWLESDKPFCALFGSNGIGKSVAAAYALRLATSQVSMRPNHEQASLIQVDELDSGEGLFLPAHELRHASRFADGKAFSTLERAGRVKVLVIDELRDVDFKGVGLERLEEVLAERYQRRARTVITSNLTQKQVMGRFSALLQSRFEAGALVFESSGEDMRRQA